MKGIRLDAPDFAMVCHGLAGDQPQKRSPSLSMNETAFDPPPAGMFTTTVSMIFDGRFQHAGQPLPLSELSKIPATLRKQRYLLFPNSKAKPANDDPRNLIFTTDTQYSISPEGYRHHQREVARKINLEEMRASAQAQLEEQIKYEIENPDPQTKAALEIAEEDYRMSVQGQIASQNI